MRTGISLTVSPIDRQRLSALIRDRNAPQKHVWRAEIILSSGNGVGTVEIKPANPRPAYGAGSSASLRKASKDCCATRRGPRAFRLAGLK